MKLSEYAKKHSITYQTALKHYHKGLIEGAYQLATGTIVVPELTKTPQIEKTYAIYTRVSSSQNKNDLATQAERLTNYCMARGYKIKKIVKEVGSGLNDNRPKFLTLLEDSTIDVIVVEHKDRATRFGFKYLESLLKVNDRSIEVVNESAGNKEDLLEDLVAIITSFLTQYYGQRQSKQKTNAMIKALKLEDEIESS